MNHLKLFGEYLLERKFSSEKRGDLADKGKAMKDGSFPIVTVQDLKNAIKSWGRAKDPDKTKRWIVKRAKEMGKLEILPQNWNIR